MEALLQDLQDVVAGMDLRRAPRDIAPLDGLVEDADGKTQGHDGRHGDQRIGDQQDRAQRQHQAQLASEREKAHEGGAEDRAYRDVDVADQLRGIARQVQDVGAGQVALQQPPGEQKLVVGDEPRLAVIDQHQKHVLGEEHDDEADRQRDQHIALSACRNRSGDVSQPVPLAHLVRVYHQVDEREYERDAHRLQRGADQDEGADADGAPSRRAIDQTQAGGQYLPHRAHWTENLFSRRMMSGVTRR